MKNIIIGAMLMFIVLSTVIYIFMKNKTPLVDLSAVPTSGEPQIIGGDRDEHGCLGPAGYSWCADKNKCLRIWEEDCQSLSKIKAALIKKDKLDTDILITVTSEEAKYARGQISGPNGGPGGIFLAAKVGEDWKIVYSGNGSVDCPAIKADYQFPQSMLAGFCDP